MLLALAGVLQDGSGPRPGPPENPRRTINVTQGSDVTIRLAVTTPSGQPVALAGGSLILSVKKRPPDSPAAVAKVGTFLPAEGPNVASFALAPADTKNLVPGRYFYDVWLTLGGKRDPVVPPSPFLLEATISPVP